MTFTERFLKAKHWHLFLLTFGIPLLMQFVFIGTMIASFGKGTKPDPSVLFNFFMVVPVLMIVVAGAFFGWFWSIAIGLQSRVPEHIQMKTTRFKVFFVIPLVYMLLITIGIWAAFSSIPNQVETNFKMNPIIVGRMIGIIFPLHLFSMFCILHSIYFVAKTYKTVELQRETTFSDFVGEFFLIWFYPIGIWIIQPKINKMVEEVPPVN